MMTMERNVCLSGGLSVIRGGKGVVFVCCGTSLMRCVSVAIMRIFTCVWDDCMHGMLALFKHVPFEHAGFMGVSVMACERSGARDCPQEHWNPTECDIRF